MPSEKSDLSDLTKDWEGRWVVAEYLECDREAEGSTINLYQIVQGTAHPHIFPQASLDPGALPYENGQILQQAFTLLRKHAQTAVYAPWTLDTFLGIQFGFTDLDEVEDPIECQQWCERRSMRRDGDFYHAFLEAGFSVIEYDVNSDRYCEFSATE